MPGEWHIAFSGAMPPLTHRHNKSTAGGDAEKPKGGGVAADARFSRRTQVEWISRYADRSGCI